MVTKLIGILSLLTATSAFGQFSGRGGLQSSDYCPACVESSAGQDHFLIIGQKTGAGCGDSALLLLSYDGIKMVEPSLVARAFREFSFGKIGDREGQNFHHNVAFDRWDIPHCKLYLVADGSKWINGKQENWEQKIVYDLRTKKMTLSK